MGITLLDTVIVFSTAITTLAIAALVYSKNRKERANRLFGLMAASISTWILAAFFSEIVLQYGPQLSLFLSKIAYISVTLAVLFLLYFVFTFPKRRKFPHYLQFLILAFVGILIFLIFFTNLILAGITVREWGFDINFGPLYFLFLIFISCSIVTAISLLIYSYFKVSKKDKIKLRYLFIGLFLFIGISVFVNLILRSIVGTDMYYRLGNYSVFFFIGFTAYAIVKTQLFNIRVIATEVLIALISLGLLVDIFVSKTILEGGLKGVLFVLISYGGYKLILSVHQEIRRREEIQELTDQLKKANIRLQELDQLKSEFLSVASHELNSPMAIILGYLHMVLYEGFGKVDKTAREYLEKVYQRADLLAKLVKDLLNVSRIEQGRLKIEVQPTDLETILKDLSEDHALAAKEKGLSFTYHKPTKPLPKVLADPDKVKEIVQNLLSNAVKFTKKGGIEVWAEVADKEVRVTVKDTGVGIPKEAQPHIGEKFYRVDNSLVREVGGTGLGLHLVQQYIKLMNGKFWFESEGENKGSTFYFTLPAVKESV